MAEQDKLKTQKLIVGVFSILLVIVLIIVAGVEMKQTQSTKLSAVISGDNNRCVDCHTNKGMAVKAIDAWKESVHAQQNIGCLDCHKANKEDFDAFYCPESDLLVAKHPTPKDCAECHEQQVNEFADSKHAHQFWLIKNTDRSIFETPIATRHGCEQCHQIGNVWPDQSVGECDACHPKHTFSKAVARQPETCGECHIGPDHPHIEIYLESKHGNIFRSKEKSLDLNYSTKDYQNIPLESPVCTTCHMDGNEKQPMTHNVSERLAWESQAAWSFRTVWNEEELGSWEMKRARMESICSSCHSPNFISTYLLTADLVNLQYNEMRRKFVYWTKKLTANGTIKTLKANGKEYSDPVLNGWDETPEILMYHAWHHEGRRFRHGAIMMGADYTQWHGVWELQHDLVELITWAAERGDQEAKQWVNSTHPTKFVPYPIFDIPGNAWGINVLSNTFPFLYTYPDYWERIYSNVEEAHKNKLLSDTQWQFWQNRYNNKEHFLGTKYNADSVFKFYKDRDAIDTKAFNDQAVNLKLPGKSFMNF
ncbi:MAG TPA: multiheme c-type cytochrome [Melioribacteraceae bacterium]|nr:multiheme c-type cytochrome [Melioribacteraceae bacterium]